MPLGESVSLYFLQFVSGLCYGAAVLLVLFRLCRLVLIVPCNTRSVLLIVFVVFVSRREIIIPHCLLALLFIIVGLLLFFFLFL